jgi:hypothetical protein
MQAMVTLLATIAPTSPITTYNRDLSLAGAVSMKQKLDTDLLEGQSFALVYAGPEEVAPADTAPNTLMTSEFGLEIACFVKDASSETIVEELEDLIRDIKLAVFSDRSLGGVVEDSRVIAVDAPDYGLHEKMAGTVVHVGCIKDWDSLTEA